MAGELMARLFSGKLREQLAGKAMDEFLEVLLRVMDLAFCLSNGYRKNIKGFDGRYLFRTSEGLVATSAVFGNGDMKVKGHAIEDWDVRITFKDAAALKDFIFSKDQDILDSLLKNEVEVDGNLNHIYKFGFMARDLGKRLGFV
jgi:hypothetical protein